MALVRRFEQKWTQILALDLRVLHDLEEPIHPYDLLARVRMMTWHWGQGDRHVVLDHAEKTIRHEGMDCADFRVVLTESAPVGSPPGHAFILGRGLVCAHPSDPHRIVEILYRVRNLDGRLLAVDQRAGDAFVDSIRWLAIDEGGGAAE